MVQHHKPTHNQPMAINQVQPTTCNQPAASNHLQSTGAGWLQLVGCSLQLVGCSWKLFGCSWLVATGNCLVAAGWLQLDGQLQSTDIGLLPYKAIHHHPATSHHQLQSNRFQLQPTRCNQRVAIDCIWLIATGYLHTCCDIAKCYVSD